MAGKLVHFEIPAGDAARAKGFWSGVLEWEFGDSAMPDFEYYMVRTGEDQGGAVMPSQGSSGIVVYFDTDDIDASIGRVREGGGTARPAVARPCRVEQDGHAAEAAEVQRRDPELGQGGERVEPDVGERENDAPAGDQPAEAGARVGAIGSGAHRDRPDPRPGRRARYPSATPASSRAAPGPPRA